MTADQLYGYGPRNTGEGVDTSPTSKTTAGVSSHMNLGWNNQLFWLLVLILIVVGYLGFAFDVNLKRVGEVRVASGNRS